MSAKKRENRKKYQVQKLSSTRNVRGLKYAPELNEFAVREVAVLKFQISVVTLK